MRCGCCFNCHGETIVPAFSFSTKHKDLKCKGIKLTTEEQPRLILFVVYIGYFEEKFLKNWQKIKVSSFDKLVKTCAEYLPKRIQSSVLPKIPLTRRSRRTRIFQKDE